MMNIKKISYTKKRNPNTRKYDELVIFNDQVNNEIIINEQPIIINEIEENNNVEIEEIQPIIINNQPIIINEKLIFKKLILNVLYFFPKK